MEREYHGLVMGMHFRGSHAKEIAANLPADSQLSLEREPDNAFDANAIKVFYEDTWIGYVERGVASFMARDMDEGKNYIGIVEEIREVDTKGKINYHPYCLFTVE